MAIEPHIVERTVILCEGMDECSMLQVMKRKNEIRKCYITHIGKSGGGFGRNALYQELLSFGADLTKIERFLIVIDAEDSFQNSFNDVVSAVSAINQHPDFRNRISIPISPFQLSTSCSIATACYVMPGSAANGSFDTIVLNALRAAYPNEAACADAYFQCASPPHTIVKKEKALVKSILAMINAKQPSYPLHRIWRRFPKLIPTTLAEFDDLKSHINQWVV